MDRNEAYELNHEIISKLTQPQPTVIGIEGGPSGGKTTLIDRLRNEESTRQVVCLPEAATEHILQLADKGVSVGDLENGDREGWLAFEKEVLGTIVSQIEEARQLYSNTDTIIVVDRCDIGAYVTRSEYQQVLGEIGLDVPPMLSHVDKLYYLPSVAHIDPRLYDKLKSSNAARLESTSRAQQVCSNNLAAISRHPELSIYWGGDFSATIDSLTSSILQPELERELKLRPNNGTTSSLSYFQDAKHLTSTEITQSYHEFDGMNYRLRQTLTEQGEIVYTFTVKHGSGIERLEQQRVINRRAYQALSMGPMVGLPLRKRRDMLLKDEPAFPGKKRLWSMDRYYNHGLESSVTIETDVRNEQEALYLLESVPGFEMATQDNKQLAKRLGESAL